MAIIKREPVDAPVEEKADYTEERVSIPRSEYARLIKQQERLRIVLNYMKSKDFDTWYVIDNMVGEEE